MELMKWSATLELGLEHVDNQHKQLFNMINELNIAIEYNRPNSVLIPLVERLQNYASSHFKVEEDLFSIYGYPFREDHEADHNRFKDSVKYIRRQCELIDSPMSRKIRDFLMSWLANHIMNKDKEYKHFIDAHPIS